MNPTSWSKIESEFIRIVDLPAKEKKTALLLLAESDPEIYAEVNALLEEDEAPHPLFSAQLKHMQAAGPKPGEEIGAYRIVRLLGTGGMGQVFLAERHTEDFQQQVALKLIRVSGSDGAIERHFAEERQILAGLQHNHIAALYDGGISDKGQPFFTMEYVEGQPLSQFAHQKSLNLHERLQLFLQVCEAVSYAHQQFVAHLDLKPGNILVTKHDNVKLLDFGLARMLSEEDPSPAPRFTPAYAAPEQLEGKNLSTASDIYSLGVILYELIGGQLPHRPDNSSLQAWRDLRREVPIRPSVLSSSHPEAKGIVGDDLDRICLHALASRPEDRYDSVQQLAGDIRAVIEDRPISLRENESAYQVRKHLYRNRTVVGLVALGVGILVSLTTWYTLQLQKERNLAREEAIKANQLTDLMQSVFVQADPMENQGEKISARDLLDQAVKKLPETLSEQRDLEAEMLRIMSGTYSSLGLFDRADSLVQRALKILQEEQPTDPEALGKTWLQSGAIRAQLADYPGADSCFQNGLAYLSEVYEPDDSLYIIQLEHLANNYIMWNQIDQADSLYKLIYHHYVEWFPAPDKRLAHIIHLLGVVAHKHADRTKADSLFRQSLEMKKQVYEAPHSEIAYTLNYLASTHMYLQNYKQAKSYALNSLSQRLATLGNAHVETLGSQGNVARIYSHLGMHDSAIVSYDSTLAIAERVFKGKDHFYYASLMGAKAGASYRAGKIQQSRDLFLQAIPIMRASLPDTLNDGYARLYFSLGKSYIKLQQWKLAAQQLETSLFIQKKALPEGHVRIAWSQVYLAEALKALGQPERAVELLREAHATLLTLQQDGDLYSPEFKKTEELMKALGITEG